MTDVVSAVAHKERWTVSFQTALQSFADNAGLSISSLWAFCFGPWAVTLQIFIRPPYPVMSFVHIFMLQVTNNVVKCPGFIASGLCCRGQKTTAFMYHIKVRGIKYTYNYSSYGGPFHISLTLPTERHNVNLWTLCCSVNLYVCYLLISIYIEFLSVWFCEWR